MSPSEIEQKFLVEFNPISDLFIIHNLSIEQAEKSKDSFIHHPGVYVFMKGDEVIKIGRSLENSRKRALEHIRDNTQVADFMMRELPNYPDSRLLLFNLKEIKNSHWAAALEIYFEEKLDPKIKSKRKA